MKPFAYASPRTIDEAIALLSPSTMANGGSPRPLAGGTDLLTLM